MSSKQGPRKAGMCASANAAGDRHTESMTDCNDKEVAA